MAAVYAYLSFSDKCEEAFEFYRSVFGGEFTSFSRMGDTDFGMDMISEEEKSKVMHVSLPIGDTEMLHRLRERSTNGEVRSAGASCLVDAELPGPGRP